MTQAQVLKDLRRELIVTKETLADPTLTHSLMAYRRGLVDAYRLAIELLEEIK